MRPLTPAWGRRHAGAVPMLGTDWKNVQPARLRTLVLLTLALGTTVAASWLVFGGRAAFGGPDRVLEQFWPAIYGSQALLAALCGLWVGRVEPSRVWMLTLVTGAWLGELLALTLGGHLLANELDPPVAWFYWWMATGGPLQPVAASAGGLLAGRCSDLILRRPHPKADARTSATTASRAAAARSGPVER